MEFTENDEHRKKEMQSNYTHLVHWNSIKYLLFRLLRGTESTIEIKVLPLPHARKIMKSILAHIKLCH